MEYISVTDAAIKFNISERRVQKLCETNRIEGCHRFKGVWLIPKDAKKPTDARTTSSFSNDNILTLNDLCTQLSISVATGRNWLKLGKIKPDVNYEGSPAFSKAYVDKLVSSIASGDNSSLKSRRNKKFITGNSLYSSYISNTSENLSPVQNILDKISANNLTLNKDIISYLVADCAIKLFVQIRKEISVNSQSDYFIKYLNNKIDLDDYNELIDELINDKKNALHFYKNNSDLFSEKYGYEPYEDILGLIYISLCNIGDRKNTGSYYTPTSIVKSLISNLNISNTDKILDPCSGTGNFLLQLPKRIPFNNIYGNDIDPLSIRISRLNMALKYPKISVKTIKEHITISDYLNEYDKSNFHFIIGNPPWGYDFTPEERENLRKKYRIASKKTDSFDLFIEESLNKLIPQGELSFVLPASVLNVMSHLPIREILLNRCSIKYIEYLGNAFNDVQCPGIIFQAKLTNERLSTKGMIIKNGETHISIRTEREVSSERFSFNITDEEYKIIEKIKNNPNSTTLAGQAYFALGIVTGDNKGYITNKKSKTNEKILKGLDICKYHIKETNNYIDYKPETFQQVAPTEMYRAPEKLLYRFISSQLVFAYDDQQTLSLNSCNIVIPNIPNLDTKYILAILNSRIAQFIFQKEFDSIKVLRSHIESIPIPIVDKKTQNLIIKKTSKLIDETEPDNIEQSYDELDQMISDIYHLSNKEYSLIYESLKNNNLFLK